FVRFRVLERDENMQATKRQRGSRKKCTKIECSIYWCDNHIEKRLTHTIVSRFNTNNDASGKINMPHSTTLITIWPLSAWLTKQLFSVCFPECADLILSGRFSAAAENQLPLSINARHSGGRRAVKGPPRSTLRDSRAITEKRAQFEVKLTQ
ncbi:hypothetical protein, partial [Lentibacillus halophilus]|uniref:hypothetical protein n=1 Tax=Lentibacillus halophilus TaxID=295065 RepID=UPI0031D21720